VTERTDDPTEGVRMGTPGSVDPGESEPFRQRARQRLGVTRRQWEYLVACLVAGPYLLSTGAYFLFDISETAFLVGTAIFSVIAMYGSYKL
jgi:hypothetical protein